MPDWILDLIRHHGCKRTHPESGQKFGAEVDAGSKPGMTAFALWRMFSDDDEAVSWAVS